MKVHEASIDIAAPPEAVWPVMAAGDGWPSWESSVTSFEGTIARGGKISLVSEVSPKRTFTLDVSEFDDGRSFAFSDGMPFGLFTSTRRYVVSAAGEGASKVHVREEHTGPLSGLMSRVIPDLTPSIQKFVAGLKAEVEGASA